MHAAIMAWGEDLKVTKYLDFDGEDSLAKATAHVLEHIDSYPDAFVAEHPGVPVNTWAVDTENRSITASLPPDPQTPEEIERQKKLTRPLSPMQFNAAIMINGLNEGIRNAIDSMSSPDKEIAISKLEYGNRFYRKDPLVQSLSSALNLTPTEVDELWLSALEIE